MWRRGKMEDLMGEGVRSEMENVRVVGEGVKGKIEDFGGESEGVT